jgi:hypothetical protein
MSYFNRTTIANSANAVIDPASEESVILLRRIVKLLEVSSTSDFRSRQKVVVEAIGTNTGIPTELNTSLPVSGTVAANTTAVASTVNMGQVVVGFGGQATAATNIIDSRFSMIDTARNTYALGIRSNLLWS